MIKSAKKADRQVPHADGMPAPLSVEDLSPKLKRKPSPQPAKQPKNFVRIIPTVVKDHFKWALIMSVSCFFLVGPCWALCKVYEVRRMIEASDVKGATHLSSRIASVLMLSTIIGVIVWVAILFCSAGLLLTGQLLKFGSIK